MTAILLIHGAWHGPWCWHDFARRLTERGHEVRAVQLRGHDQAPGRIWHRVRHYVDDVRRAAVELSTPPLLVGHSLGGLVAQRYAERNPAAGLVLMASIPPGGTIATVARLAVRHPIPFLKANLLLRLRPLVATRSLVRDLFFAADTPQEIVERCFARLQDESYLAFIDTMIVLARPHRVNVPALVLGAEWDTFFTVREVQATARAYRTEAEIFPGMGHDMMLDEGWHKVADRVHAWVHECLHAEPLGTR